MDAKQVVLAKLAEYGIELAQDELTDLVGAYDAILTWQAVVEEMAGFDTEPATTFNVLPRGGTQSGRS